jgi:myo-inositol-1(or 4)-monophosphatase
VTDRSQDLARIERALRDASVVLSQFKPGAVSTRFKAGDDPVTAADIAVDRVLRRALQEPGEGWLSEETADDVGRLTSRRVWIVDPLDGTREFVQGIPEWCVSVGLVEDGLPVVGGVVNPQTGVEVLGAVGTGVMVNGRPATRRMTAHIEGALMLASRSEVRRGEWDRFFSTPVSIRNMGSVAWKLALVAAGQADATWTLVPKHEWDVAGGAALVRAAGGRVMLPDGSEVRFNLPDPRLPGFVASTAGVADAVLDLIHSRP